MAMPTILAVDGNSLCHRAWHAIESPFPQRPWVAGGVVRMLASAWLEGPFDAVIVAFDGQDNLRKQRWPEYKAHRPDNDPLLVDQIQWTYEILASCGFQVVQEAGYEGDDVLALVADQARTLGAHAWLLSSDRDLLALVSEHATMLRPRSSMAALKVYRPADVEAEFGVTPAQYHELAAMRGDPSDGLDGVPGVGAKRAAKLLRTYDSVTRVYSYLGELSPSLREALLAGRPNLERNLEAMAPMTDGLSVDVAAAIDDGIDLELVRETLTSLGLESSAAKFRRAIERGPLPPLPPPPEAPMDDGVEAQRPAPTSVLPEVERLELDEAEGEQPSLF